MSPHADIIFCCGKRSTVTDTRARDGTLMRRRRCQICKHTWSTIEVDMPIAPTHGQHAAAMPATPPKGPRG